MGELLGLLVGTLWAVTNILVVHLFPLNGGYLLVAGECCQTKKPEVAAVEPYLSALATYVHVLCRISSLCRYSAILHFLIY